ncbi:cupin [Sporanaerobium hydrogeniformans]|uniref:Cupin n=1 Tax=Sporanaerobium hydrogeniformans TaxID=3072179 RepID=A0AC61DFD3_9FIRM|nr:cupin domain-containing protein [Sporanaerobium hydrogeniformans]PHV71605.1 cupin [Sporanaerobium hydrogeniformans]
MKKCHQGQKWVFNKDYAGEQVAEGVERKVLAFCECLMCVENHFEEGAIGAMHNHPHTQITYVVEGEFEFTISGETKRVTKGDTMLKENGIMHGCKCLKKGILLDVFTPMREDFIG